MTASAASSFFLSGPTTGAISSICRMRKENENFHVYAVDPLARTTRDLIPFDNVTARIHQISHIVRDRILVGLNLRDLRFHDLYSVDPVTGDIELVEENPGFDMLICDRRH
jgi:hypothetical protein